MSTSQQISQQAEPQWSADGRWWWNGEQWVDPQPQSPMPYYNPAWAQPMARTTTVQPRIQVKVYGGDGVKAFQKDAPKMAAQGWVPQTQSTRKRVRLYGSRETLTVTWVRG